MFVMLPFLLIFKSGFLVFGMICLALAAAFVTVLWITAEVIRERWKMTLNIRCKLGIHNYVQYLSSEGVIQSQGCVSWHNYGDMTCLRCSKIRRGW